MCLYFAFMATNNIYSTPHHSQQIHSIHTLLWYQELFNLFLFRFTICTYTTSIIPLPSHRQQRKRPLACAFYVRYLNTLLVPRLLEVGSYLPLYIYIALYIFIHRDNEKYFDQLLMLFQLVILSWRRSYYSMCSMYIKMLEETQLRSDIIHLSHD